MGEWRFRGMTFYNFFMSKLESVALSETVIESFLDSDDFTMFYKKRKKRHQVIQSHLKD